MTSTITNSIPLPSVERRQFPNGDLVPTLLLSPANLPTTSDWSENQEARQSYLFNHMSRNTKSEKSSITDKFKRVFRKKDRNSQSSDSSHKIPRPEAHRRSETYFPTIAGTSFTPHTTKDHRHSEIYFPTYNVAEVKQDICQQETQNAVRNPTGVKQEFSNSNQIALSDFSVSLNVLSPNIDKKSSSILNLSKNKFKSSLQIFASTFKRTKQSNIQDILQSECPSNDIGETLDQNTVRYFPYNTVNADGYKGLFEETPVKDSPESYQATISPGRNTASNFRQVLSPPVKGKKNRFVVSSAKTDKDQLVTNGAIKTRQTTIMAQLLRRSDDKRNYNTVGPQDNRDRRPSVTLNDFLEMYKEKNLNNSDAYRKATSERKRSISESEFEIFPHIGHHRSNSNQPLPTKTPIITLTSTGNQNRDPRIINGADNSCAYGQPVDGESQRVKDNFNGNGEDMMIGDAMKQHSIPEHQEVHHDSQTPVAYGKVANKNRFINRGVVNSPDDNKFKKKSFHHSRHASTDCTLSFENHRMASSSVYDHSLTVSGYPRRTSRLNMRKTTYRRMSEPNQNNEKWPELKTNTSTTADEIITHYRKVNANSLGIDIPTDEFHNKLLVWIDKKRGTKILPLPHNGHDVWSGNKDQNSAICYLAKRFKCYNVMPNSGKLVLFDSELPVTAAFEAFTFNRVRSAPIWDAKKKQLTGMLTVSDFIDVLLICADQPELFEKITEQNISDWKSMSNKAKLEANKSMEANAIDEAVDLTITQSYPLNEDLKVKSDSLGESVIDLNTETLKSQEFSPDVKTPQTSIDFSDDDITSSRLNKLHSSTETETSKLEISLRELSMDDSNNPTNSINVTTKSDANSPKTSTLINTTEASSGVLSPGALRPTGPPRVRTSSLDPDDGSISFDTGLISVESDDTLYDAISVLKTFSFHRVLVMDYTDNDPLYILTYKRILYFIYVMMDTIGIPPFMSSSIKDLNVGTFTNLITIKYATTLREALTLLQWRSFSAIPVLDDHGKVVDLYTKEDVMNLVYNNKFTQLNSTIEEILHDNRRVFEGLFKCKETDSLMAVVQYFISSKAHRLVVTSEENLLKGIISLSDVVNFMVLGCQSDGDDDDDDIKLNAMN